MANHQRYFRLRSQAAAGSGRSRGALRFFAWAFTKGDKMAEQIGYVPLPKNVIAEIENIWATKIKDATGKPLYTGQ